MATTKQTKKSRQKRVCRQDERDQHLPYRLVQHPQTRQQAHRFRSLRKEGGLFLDGGIIAGGIKIVKRLFITITVRHDASVHDGSISALFHFLPVEHLAAFREGKVKINFTPSPCP